MVRTFWYGPCTRSTPSTGVDQRLDAPILVGLQHSVCESNDLDPCGSRRIVPFSVPFEIGCPCMPLSSVPFDDQPPFFDKGVHRGGGLFKVNRKLTGVSGQLGPVKELVQKSLQLRCWWLI